MPRANRCILPGYTYHLTHRCHNRSWLFRFARDRTEYCKRLRVAAREFRISLLTFCLKYIDLNMVRAGVVGHPQEWRWCGFSELTGLRQRYRMLDQAEVLRMHGDCTAEQFADNYRVTIEEALALDPAAGAAARRAEGLERDSMWTESIAVGGEQFVRKIEEETRNRMELDITPTSSGAWTIRETPEPYG